MCGRSERKAMIDRSHDLAAGLVSSGIGHQPGQRLLPAASGCGVQSRRHAPDSIELHQELIAVAGCCATCWWAKASRSGACTSRR